MSDFFNNLTPQQQTEYRALESVFESDGWGILKRRFQDQVTQAEKQLEYTKTWDDTLKMRAYLTTMRTVLRLDEDFDSAYESLAEANLEEKLEKEMAVESELL